MSKKATAVTGTTNQWQVTLTITGKDLVQSSNADIVLVIDRSGSMSENSRMDNAKAAATFFINTLLTPGNTSRRIAIVSFATNVTINPGNVNDAFKGADQKQTLLDVIN
ncbi:MAG TPA: VWA domain-containing protein, partial [Clostridia bacterium]|nr:VWA domain-containing protein [Clostridia bacterium]